MIVKVPSLALGVNKDAQPEELPIGQWSDVLNVRFRAGAIERTTGMEQIYSAPSVTPYWLTPYRTATTSFWVHAGIQKVFAEDGTTRTEITPAAVFTGAVTDRWTGGVLNGVLVMNNSVERPQYWLGNVVNDLAVLPNWDANHLCKVIRPWRNYLFALDLTKTGTRYPYMVKWSSAADPGTYPASWNEADPSNDAGELDLAETPDGLVDCLPLGEVLVIYKQRSMYSCRYIGGQFIFQFSRLPGDTGMLARGCAAQVPDGHVVLTNGDVILHSGAGPTSICDGVVRRAIFDAMDGTYSASSFVVANPSRTEVWICYSEGGAVCTKAAIWNWADSTWTFRSLPNVTYGAVGQANVSDPSSTWASDSAAWSSDDTSWSSNNYSPNEARMILCHTAPALSLADSSQLDLTAAITAYAERTGMYMDDAQTVKMVRGVWPRIDAIPGTTLTIEVGASMTPDVAPTYSAAQTFTVGTSAKIDTFATGRYLALKLSSTAAAKWRLRGLDFDVVTRGTY
jgi:hypothetical protein